MNDSFYSCSLLKSPACACILDGPSALPTSSLLPSVPNSPSSLCLLLLASPLTQSHPRRPFSRAGPCPDLTRRSGHSSRPLSANFSLGIILIVEGLTWHSEGGATRSARAAPVQDVCPPAKLTLQDGRFVCHMAGGGESAPQLGPSSGPTPLPLSTHPSTDSVIPVTSPPGLCRTLEDGCVPPRPGIIPANPQLRTRPHTTLSAVNKADHR